MNALTPLLSFFRRAVEQHRETNRIRRGRRAVIDALAAEARRNLAPLGYQEGKYGYAGREFGQTFTRDGTGLLIEFNDYGNAVSIELWAGSLATGQSPELSQPAVPPVVQRVGKSSTGEEHIPELRAALAPFLAHLTTVATTAHGAQSSSEA